MRTETRPWGRFEVIYEDETMWLKRIYIAPGQSLSLQVHAHRDEHWLAQSAPMASYRAETIEGRLWPGEIVSVPRGHQHRLWNPCETEAVVLEWATGHPMEDDIIRLDDLYGR